MKSFEGFGLSAPLNRSLAKMGYTEPTPIQAQAIPLALKGRDVLGSAQTGTGKTAAFGIPLVEALLRNPRGSALVMTPTRELAKQVLDVIHDLLGPKSPIKTAFIIGGESMNKQYAQLRAQPRIIVGTPGRINDHLERRSMNLHDTGFLVLDETDRMLDMGFGIQLDKILKYLPDGRQTLMFSATMPKEIVQLSGKYLNNPERISIGATNVIAKNIQQDVIRIDQGDKYKELVNQLNQREGTVIVFAKTKYGSARIAKNLQKDGFKADALHGDMRQNQRTTVMNSFRKKNFRILVATDIAARGLDVPHIEHVINFDLPQVAEDYIHRMGRTARAGAVGSAISFVSSEDSRKWHAIECLLDPEKKKSGAPPKGNGRGRGFRSGPGGKGKPKRKFVGPRNASGGGEGKNNKNASAKNAGVQNNVSDKADGKVKAKVDAKPNANGKPSGNAKPGGNKKAATKFAGKKQPKGGFGNGKPSGGDARPRRKKFNKGGEKRAAAR